MNADMLNAVRTDYIQYLKDKIREHRELLKNSEDRTETLLQSNMLTMEMFEAGEQHRATLKRVIKKTEASLKLSS